MSEELTKEEIIEAKREARRIRVRTIRHRVAYGAAVAVAAFSGLALFRSFEQQNPGTTANASSSEHDDDEHEDDSIVGRVISTLGDAPGSDDPSDSGSSPAPLTTSQS